MQKEEQIYLQIPSFKTNNNVYTYKKENILRQELKEKVTKIRKRGVKEKNKRKENLR